VVGDRLDTDIAGARRAGMVGLLVLTGLTTPAQLLRAPVEERPDHVSADLSGLLEPAAAVRRSGEDWCCGSSSASVVDGVLSGRWTGGDPQGAITGDLVDLLRAACAAAWEQGPDVLADLEVPTRLGAALEELGRRCTAR
jgi:hypothetical protein